MTGRFSLLALVKALGLMVRAPGWAIQWSTGYRRARGAFRRQLMAQGVPEAKELAELYPFKMGDLIEAAKGS
ncbi:MAG: hypothetical protein V1924_02255 [Candidatus Bathyarchaeota archaeon]